jgi:hypothetical protein
VVWQWDVATPKQVGNTNYQRSVELLGRLCQFPNTIAQQILNLNRRSRSLGDVVLAFSELYEATSAQPQQLLTTAQATVLNENVRYWGKMIENCIDAHGIESVLIDEPWSTTYGVFNRLATPIEERIPGLPKKPPPPSIIDEIEDTPYFWVIAALVIGGAVIGGAALYRFKPWERRWVVQFV